MSIFHTLRTHDRSSFQRLLTSILTHLPLFASLKLYFSIWGLVICHFYKIFPHNMTGSDLWWKGFIAFYFEESFEDYMNGSQINFTKDHYWTYAFPIVVHTEALLFDFEVSLWAICSKSSNIPKTVASEMPELNTVNFLKVSYNSCQTCQT